ncbi:enoyl-ACP reductase [Chloracidobacterium sp. D]|uniref:enoyl-ACP reductase FabI n=1 Tax=Chloracidobacterium sp. D TaxID=2821536 RepID=UPI001B8BCB52|nr:enoyl-ACP reductase [Chloracidobacterium sp. D]QUV82465.1 enoyl-ACP reductase [Chloracidobacterium sp. D]
MLTGKKGVILGVANKRSIAWGIAQATAQAGATLALNYQNERLEANVRELAAMLDNPFVAPCDVTSDADIAAFFEAVKTNFGTLDFLVHAVAYAPKEDLEGAFVDTSREGFRIAHDISAYSLTAVARAALPLMKDHGGSIVTLTYLGSERAVVGYNVMGVAKAALEASVRYLAADLGPYGIRVNAISAGPINTLAARGIQGFTKMLKHHAAVAPLRRPTEVAEVADTALFLVSHMGRGITGEVIYVDGGYHCIGLVPKDEPA